MSSDPRSTSPPSPWRRAVPLVLPLLVYLLLGTLEPGLGESSASSSAPGSQPTVSKTEPEAVDHREQDSGFRRQHLLPTIYSVRVLLTIAILLAFWETYRQFPFRVHVRAVGYGLVGGILWIGLCRLHLEQQLLALVGAESWLGDQARTSFDPINELRERPWVQCWFLGVRFLGLVIAVPIAEELFLRGFLLRFLHGEQWWQVPLASLGARSVLFAAIYAVLTHPTEAIAACVWFALVSHLMLRTGRLWDCIVAHAVTNLMLGIYIVLWQDWRLW